MLFKFRKLHFGELKGVKGSYRPSAWGVKGRLWDKRLSLFPFQLEKEKNKKKCDRTSNFVQSHVSIAKIIYY